MKIRFFAIILVNVIFLSNTFAQTRSNYINFETLDIESGLSQNYVNCIFEDHSGLIWIGTEDGLNRYDGINFLKYFNDFKIKNSISGSQVMDIVEDKNNNLWISTKEDGLNKLNSNRKFFTSYFNNPQKYNYFPNISNLEYDGNTKIWFLTDNKIYSFDIVSEILQNIKLEVDTSFDISDFIIPNENELLISSQKNTFLRYDIVNNKISKKYSLDENASITTIFEHKNKIIIGTFEGEIFIFDTETETYESIFKSVVLKQNQSFIFGRDTSKIVFTTSKICVNSENNIFISGREAIISLRFETDFRGNETISSVYYLANFNGNSIIADNSDNLWLGTNGRGIKIFNEKFNNFKSNYNYDDFRNFTNIESIRTFSENSDFLFVGGYCGLIFINKTNFEITNFTKHAKQNNPNVFQYPRGVEFEPSFYCILPDPR